MRTFASGLAVLTVSPADRNEHGEKPNQIFGARARLVDAVGTVEIKEEWAKRMMHFAAWSLWESRSSDMYLSQGQVRYFANNWALEPAALLQAVCRHPSQPNMCTTFDLFAKETAVSGMLASARWLGMNAGPCAALDTAQSAAVAHIMRSPFSALQGGAGVGKTTTVVELLRQLGGRVPVACVAFTHKARRCVEQRLVACGVKAHVSTIHSFINLLNSENGSASFQSLFLLIDESSMVDMELLGEMAMVLRERVPSYQMCFIGDTHQLPPVGRGEFYRQLVDSRKGLAELTICYRTDRADLFEGFQSVRRGEVPPSSQNFQVILVDDDKGVNSVVGGMINRGTGAAQLITWQNKDVFRLNAWVQEALVKQGRVGPDSHRGFYTHDRVVFVGDNTETLTNAMVGTVDACWMGGLEVAWEDGTRSTFKSYPRGLQLAYCLTVHKSQGSEYDDVVVPCYSVDKMMSCLDRRFVYTAVTRAKKTVTLVAPRTIGAFLAKALASAPPTSVRIP